MDSADLLCISCGVQGAAALITTPAYLTAAAGILAIEAYHAGSIREQLIQNSSYNVTAYGVEVYQIVGVREQCLTVLGAETAAYVVANACIKHLAIPRQAADRRPVFSADGLLTRKPAAISCKRPLRCSAVFDV